MEREQIAAVEASTFGAAGFGAGADMDEAFDEAVAAAGEVHGFAGLHASLASSEPDSVVRVGRSATPWQAAAKEATAWARDAEPGSVGAWPVAPASAFTWKRPRVVVEGALEVHLGEQPGLVLAEPDGLGALIEERLAEFDEDARAGERVGVELVRAAERYKPVVEVVRKKAAATFAVLDPSTRCLVAEGFARASDARRAAVDLAKQGPVGDGPTGELHVVKVAGREGSEPLLRVRRERVKSRLTLRVLLAAEKAPEKTKTVGWLFVAAAPERVAPTAEA